jgi:hypothetical protein
VLTKNWKKNWKTQRPSKKLDHQMADSFEITKKIGNSYEVKLFDTIKIHNVFSSDRLQKAAEAPLLGQVNKLSLLVVITTEEEYKAQDSVEASARQTAVPSKIAWP